MTAVGITLNIMDSVMVRQGLFAYGLSLAVHRFEEAMEKVAAVGPRVAAFQYIIWYLQAGLVSDSEGFVIFQFRRNVQGKDQFAFRGRYE